MKILRFKNNDIPFVVRVVEQGENYGKQFSINHSEPEPLIEFYDARFKMPEYQNDGIYLGQFVSRYPMIDFEHIKTGLFLCSGSTDWSITAENINMVQEWAKEALAIKGEIITNKMTLPKP